MAFPEGYLDTDSSASSLSGGDLRTVQWRCGEVSRKEKEAHKGCVIKLTGAQFHWQTLRALVKHFSYPNGEARKQGVIYLPPSVPHWLRITFGNINSPALHSLPGLQ